jgi:hypothetical protein
MAKTARPSTLTLDSSVRWLIGALTLLAALTFVAQLAQAQTYRVLHCCPGKLAGGWRKRLTASEISGFDAGNYLNSDNPTAVLS